MTTVTLELPPDVYRRLHDAAARVGKPVETVAQELLTEQLAVAAPIPMSDRERAAEALRAAGLLTELSPEEKQRAARSTTTLEEVQAALDRAGGKPLSELILEMRGPKE